MNGGIKFQKALKHGWLYRQWMYFTCRGDRINHKFLNGNIWPKFYDAPEPTLIMWENFGASFCNRMLRSIFVNFSFILIVVAGLFTLNIAD